MRRYEILFSGHSLIGKWIVLIENSSRPEWDREEKYDWRLFAQRELFRSLKDAIDSIPRDYKYSIVTDPVHLGDRHERRLGYVLADGSRST